MSTPAQQTEVDTGRASRSQRRRERTRADLVEAAKEILANRGPEAGVAEITDRADVAVGSLYTHFASKEQLFEIAANEVVSEFEQYMFEATAGITDPVEVLSARIRLFARSCETHPIAARIMVRSFSQQLGLQAGYRPDAMDDLQSAIATGKANPKHPEAALSAIIASGVSLLARRISDPSLGKQVVDDYAETMLAMIGLDPESAEQYATGPLAPFDRKAEH